MCRIVSKAKKRVVRALKRPAAQHDRSAEAEHRAILEAALVSGKRQLLAEVLAAMPDVGRNEDFARLED